VVRTAGLLVDDAEEHELLGEESAGLPAVVGGLPQPVRDLAQQRVAAIGRAEMQDRPLVRDGDEVALVVRRSLAELLQLAGDVDAAHEAVRVVEVVDVPDADSGHPDHVQDDRAVVGQLDAGRVRLERRPGRRHQVRHHVHRLAGRRAPHPLLEQRGHLGRRPPVVVDAAVGRVARRDDRALLGAGGVLGVAARVVEALPRGEDLAGRERLLDQPVVVGGADDLDPGRARVRGPVPHVRSDSIVRYPCPVEGGVDVHLARSHPRSPSIACIPTTLGHRSPAWLDSLRHPAVRHTV
jgi:hypothetical protein